MQYLMILHDVNGYANALQYSVLTTLFVVLKKSLYTPFFLFFVRKSCSPYSSPLTPLFMKLLRIQLLRPKHVVSEMI